MTTLRKSPVAPRSGDKIESDFIVGRGRGCNLCVERIGKLRRIRQALREYGFKPSHSGLCCVMVKGKVKVTAESCRCSLAERTLIEFMGDEWA